MKKFIFMLIAMFSMVISANAQNQKFLDNWSVGTDAGVSTNFHDWDTPNGAVWGIQLAKQITPVVAFELSGQMGFNDNANWNIPHSANGIDNITVMGSGKVNLMNLFCGYNGTPRLFEIQARGGVGYMRFFYPDYGMRHGSTDVNRMVGKLGLDFDFNVGKTKAWTLSLRPAIVFKGQNGDAWCDNWDCKRYTHNAIGQLTAGVTYHFKNRSNDNHYFTYPKPEVVTKVVERVVERTVEKPVRTVVEKVVTNDVTNKVSVNFAKGSSELTDEAKATLDKVVKGSTVDVVGMTSPEGSTEVNDALGNARAKAVADYLVNHGVNVRSANGGASARAAVVTVVK